MSFVSAQPSFVESVARDLAGVRSTLSTATTTAAGPTVSVLAAARDEISHAIAAAFGSYGQQFQSLTTQATGFHDRFTSLLHTGAFQYATAETANAAQVINGGTTALTALAADASAPFTTALQNITTAVNALTGPHQTLFANTGVNIQSLIASINAGGFPLLNQLGANRTGYATTVVNGVAVMLDNLPTTLANLPTNISTALAGFDPNAFIHWASNNLNDYRQIINTAFTNAAADFSTQLNQLPTYFTAAGQALQTGNISGALFDIRRGFLNLAVTGFDTSVNPDTDLITVNLQGPLGDLLPILSIPGQMAQNLTDIMPTGSIVAQMSQNFTNVLNTTHDTSITSKATAFLSPDPATPDNPNSRGVAITTTMGLPAARLISAAGGPVNAMVGLADSGSAVHTALQTGNIGGALTAALNTPAVVTNDFLNGHTTVPINLTAELIPGYPLGLTINLPLDGILVQPSPYTGVVDFSPTFGNPPNTPGEQGTVYFSGTPIGGLLPMLTGYLPQQLALAIGGNPTGF